MNSPASHRSVIETWADGFVDRDNNFVNEFQTRFNPCFWELYIFACLKELGLAADFAFSSPYFVVANGFCRAAFHFLLSSGPLTFSVPGKGTSTRSRKVAESRRGRKRRSQFGQPTGLQTDAIQDGTVSRDTRLPS